LMQAKKLSNSWLQCPSFPRSAPYFSYLPTILFPSSPWSPPIDEG
jgi:hypothetical protein